MHAAIMRLRIDPHLAAAAASRFGEVLLPRVAAAGGFVSGHWVDPVDGVGFGFILFDTEQQARAAMPPNADWSAPGVTIDAVDIRRVAASA